MEIMIKTQADSAFNLFRSRKILTVQEVKAIVGKSLQTTRSRLKQWNAITSYNKNGRYYTLPKIADFNEYGIWSFQGIHFSRHGNLKETFINLVTNTYRALNSTEIGHILQMPPIHSYPILAILKAFTDVNLMDVISGMSQNYNIKILQTGAK